MKDYRSQKEVQNDIEDGSLSLRDLVAAYLERIKATSDLNIFLETFDEEALSLADEIEEKIKSGSGGKLAGMVVSVKDNICYKGHKVSAASKILENFESLYHSTAVQRLLEEDAIIVGRVNCDEFAMGASNEN